MATFLMTLLMIAGIFLILLVLVQRGRGGGLAGAFGGMGGQSAFGTKAGDVFTKITAGAAVVWVLLSGVCILALRAASDVGFEGKKDTPEMSSGANDEDGEDDSIGGTTDDNTNDLKDLIGDGSDDSNDSDGTSQDDASDDSEGDSATDDDGTSTEDKSATDDGSTTDDESKTGDDSATSDDAADNDAENADADASKSTPDDE